MEENSGKIKAFNRNDEQFLEAFVIFCGLGIQNTQMYEAVERAMAKQMVTLEVSSKSIRSLISPTQILIFSKPSLFYTSAATHMDTEQKLFSPRRTAFGLLNCATTFLLVFISASRLFYLVLYFNFTHEI